MQPAVLRNTEKHPASFTGVLAEIAEIIGENGASLIADHYGGRRLYFPVNMQMDSHPLAQLIGLGGAQKLSNVFCGEDVEIPLCAARERARRNAQILADRAAGMSVREAAKKYRMTERCVRLICASSQKKRETSLNVSQKNPFQHV